MGGVSDRCRDHGTREEQDKSKKINKQLKFDFEEDSHIVKLLVLGAGESGKSTIVKQMKLIHPTDGRNEVGFTVQERMDARRAIYLNIVESMINLIGAVELLRIDGQQQLMDLDINNGNIGKAIRGRGGSVSGTSETAIDIVQHYADALYEVKTNQQSKSANEIKAFDSRMCPTQEILNALKLLWGNNAIQMAYTRRNEFQLNDSTFYFMSSLDRVCDKSFEPTEQDVLRTRVKTTGVSKIEFFYREMRFQMFDVGGQRSERKKWIHCFDNVTALLFVVSISEYDQVLEEDNSVNRMVESMGLFENIVNNEFFNLKPIIIFFNKKDLFEEKIESKGIKPFFPNYSGPPHSSADSSKFLIKEYITKSKTPQNKREMYPHLTTATDTKLVKYPAPLAIEEMAALGPYPYDGVSADELAYELRQNPQRKRNVNGLASGADSSHFSRFNRHQELTTLYGKIAKEFPFLVKQGLLRPGDRKLSIDDLLSMTVFGQPKMGKK